MKIWLEIIGRAFEPYAFGPSFQALYELRTARREATEDVR